MADENMQAADEAVAGNRDAEVHSNEILLQLVMQGLGQMRESMHRDMQEALRQCGQTMQNRMTEDEATIRCLEERLQKIEERVGRIEILTISSMSRETVVSAAQQRPLHYEEIRMSNPSGSISSALSNPRGSISSVSSSPCDTPPPFDFIQYLHDVKNWDLLNAVKEGRLPDIYRLLDAGANVNFTTADDWTPLMSAARYNHVHLALLFLLRGADINFRDNLGNTALHYAICENHEGACVSVFINAGSDVNARTNDGSTPLHHAALCNRPRIVRQLLAAGASRTAEDNFGRTPLQLALSDPVRELLVDQQDC